MWAKNQQCETNDLHRIDYKFKFIVFMIVFQFCVSSIKLFHKLFGVFFPLPPTSSVNLSSILFLRGRESGRSDMFGSASIPALTSFCLRSGDVDDEGLQL